MGQKASKISSNSALKSSSECVTEPDLNDDFEIPEATPTKQKFSLPDSIIFYMIKNPSTPEVYLKLAQSSKYVFKKNPILIVKCIHKGGKRFCSNNNYGCTDKKYGCCVKIDISKLWSKIWLIDELKFFTEKIRYYSLSDSMCSSNDLSVGMKGNKQRYFVFDMIPNAAKLFSSKIYRCENAELTVRDTKITFEKFKLLASKFQKFGLYCVEITDDESDVVMLETILESIPNLKEFKYTFADVNPAVTTSTMKNICKLKNLGNLSNLQLYNIPMISNVENFGVFIMDHKDTKIRLEFGRDVSHEYKNELDTLINDVIVSEIPNRVIEYYEQDEEKLEIMKNRFYH